MMLNYNLFLSLGMASFLFSFVPSNESSSPFRAVDPAKHETQAAFGFVQCTNLFDPLDGATGVAVTSALSWEVAVGLPVGYLLTVGTTPGGTDILNNFDVGNVTTYNPPGDFPYGTTIYVKIIGYNANGPATGCSEESFTTVAAPTPSCTSLTSPVNGATNVPANTVLTWAAATGSPTGYLLDVGTTSGGTEILNNFDVGNVTTFDPPGYLPYGATVYVKIKPYNANGTTTGCTEESFGTAGCIPNLTIVANPVPDGTHRSSGDLTSYNSTVAAATNVEFTSDTGVLLDHDFTVVVNGVFEILIQACSSGSKPVSAQSAVKKGNKGE